MATKRGPKNPELGAITQMEHVNYAVPDHGQAILFFIDGLGFTRDPFRRISVANMWINAGREQFHLPIGDPVPFAGEVGLTVPSLRETERNLKRIARRLKGTEFGFETKGGVIKVSSPWGHMHRVHEQGKMPSRFPQALAYVNFWVPVGAAAPIAAFYDKMLDAPTKVTGSGKRKTATVNVGAHQHFNFVEKASYKPVDHPNHVAVYITRYQEIHDRFKKKKLLSRPDFEEQFRFVDMANPSSGKVAFSFEHEVRSLYHPDYLKPLTNRVEVPYLVD